MSSIRKRVVGVAFVAIFMLSVSLVPLSSSQDIDNDSDEARPNFVLPYRVGRD